MEYECNLGGMNDVIALKRSSLRPTLVAIVMFLKSNMSLIPNNPTNVTKSPIQDTLIPSRPEVPYDIVDSNDNENEEGDGDDNDEDDDLSPVLVKSEEANYTC